MAPVAFATFIFILQIRSGACFQSKSPDCPLTVFGLYHIRVSEHAKWLFSDKVKLKCVPGASAIQQLMDTLSTGPVGSWSEEKTPAVCLVCTSGPD